MEKMLDHIYAKHLNLESAHHPVLFSEAPVSIKDNFLGIMFFILLNFTLNPVEF